MRPVEGFMMWGWDLFLLGWRWLYERLRTPGWGFHTDPGDRRIRPRFVGVVDVWKDF